MWDWEGKLVDEAVIERLLGSYIKFFREKPIGQEVFLTFRVPNPRVEPGYRLGRAFSEFARFSEETNIPTFPIIAPGSLPFRGGLTPKTVKDFTASCYSLGIPPELIGTGRGLKKVKIVEELYSELKLALLTAGRFLNKESLKYLNIPGIEEDILEIEQAAILRRSLG